MAGSRWARVLALGPVISLVAAGVGAAGIGAAGVGVAGIAPASAAPTAASSHGAEKAQHDTATYALTTGWDFSWMLPLENGANYEDYDSDVEDGSWLPLYLVGAGPKTAIDYTLSIGKPPVYSDGDSVVTITLNTEFTWPDGQRVTSADVQFFFELDEAGKLTLGNYLPGEMPDDITSITYPSPSTVVLHLDHAYDPTWFTDNQLTWIYPLPAQSWDKTCASCPVDGAAASPAGAKRVFDFLFSESKDLRTYATNPLWKAVDGPWTISSYDAVTHRTSFIANPHYTGPDKPKLAGYTIDTFATDAAELNALRSGAITFGYIPLSDVSQVQYFRSHGFVVKAWKFFYDDGVRFGYTSKTWGPFVDQLYIRQALQHLVTQRLYITRTLRGYGIVDYGPVADYPGSPYVSQALKKDPYPYSLSAAERLLTEHGWGSGKAGTDVCERAGAGPHDCGTGIARGEKLTLRFMYSTGTTAFEAQVSAFATAAKKVGIDVVLDGQSFTTMISIAGVCPATPPCSYGLAGYSGYLWDYGQYDSLPSGDDQFGKGNYWAGGYTTSKAQQLIEAADDSPGNGLRALYADEDYLSKDVAALWWPLEDKIVVAKKKLKGWVLDPYGTVMPITWHISG